MKPDDVLRRLCILESSSNCEPLVWTETEEEQLAGRAHLPQVLLLGLLAEKLRQTKTHHLPVDVVHIMYPIIRIPNVKSTVFQRVILLLLIYQNAWFELLIDLCNGF